jgi:putative methionine-R-sulfoxide reductase with GAF domain
MQPAELRRLIVRHRHVAPMLSVLLAATDARVHITDVDGETILDRESRADADDAPVERHPILVEGKPVGWVEGPRPAGAVASVLSYACSREADKRSLASEALDRYRELNLIYDLAERIAGSPHLADVTAVAVAEASRLPSGGVGFVLLETPGTGRLAPHPTGEAGEESPSPIPEIPAGEGILGAVFAGDPEIVNDVAADPRAGAAERPIASLVAAPLKVEGVRLGLIGTASTTPLEFHAGDLKVLTAIAALTAPAVSQAQRYETATRGEE